MGQFQCDQTSPGGLELVDGCLDGFGDAGAAVVPEEGARDPEGEIGQHRWRRDTSGVTCQRAV